ncbi:MAG: hypothetical protein LBB09_00770 [Rickettsiales bacterium]|jgi:uncharacterized membrane protein|nr:hypothetical protein [Rickettsiales bacterium]
MVERNSKIESLLPPPEVLERYKEFGLGDNLVEIIKKEQEHRHRLQRKYARSYRFGQTLGLIIVFYYLKQVFWLLSLGLDKQAYIITGILGAVALLASLILRKKRDLVAQKRAARGKGQSFAGGISSVSRGRAGASGAGRRGGNYGR